MDAEFAKSQLTLLTREWYMHPSGQLPACESTDQPALRLQQTLIIATRGA